MNVYYVFSIICYCFFFFFQAEDGIRDLTVTGVQTCALPIYSALAGKTKVTGFNIELFDNGTLKSVNAHAEDRTGQIITSTVQALGNVARGVALGKFYAAEVAEVTRSEEHTSELQSQSNLVCRLLLEKKKKKTI